MNLKKYFLTALLGLGLLTGGSQAFARDRDDYRFDNRYDSRYDNRFRNEKDYRKFLKEQRKMEERRRREWLKRQEWLRKHNRGGYGGYNDYDRYYYGR